MTPRALCCALIVLSLPVLAAKLAAEPTVMRNHDFSITPPATWGKKIVSNTDVEFVGVFNGTLSPRVRVHQYRDSLTIDETSTEALQTDFLEELKGRFNCKAEATSLQIGTVGGRSVLDVEAKLSFKGKPCRALGRFVSGSEHGFSLTYMTVEERLEAERPLILRTFDSFDTTGTNEPISSSPILWVFAGLFAVFILYVIHIFTRKVGRTSTHEPITVKVTDMSGGTLDLDGTGPPEAEAILPMEDIEDPGQMVTKRGKAVRYK